jgi:hypothetical protein
LSSFSISSDADLIFPSIHSMTPGNSLGQTGSCEMLKSSGFTVV